MKRLTSTFLFQAPSIDAFETLQTFAELGVAIIGFAALISSFQRKEKEKVTNLMRLLIMIETAGQLTFFSMLPLAFSHFFSPEIAFQFSMGLFALLVPFFSLLMRKRSKKVIGIAGLTKTFSATVIQLFAVLLMIFAGLGSIGIFQNKMGLYVSMMLGVLLIALVMFIRLIYFGLINFNDIKL